MVHDNARGKLIRAPKQNVKNIDDAEPSPDNQFSRRRGKKAIETTISISNAGKNS
jgi:hypothetical protein